MTDSVLEIDRAAFAHNVQTLSRLVAPARTMLAVKANAYGHGDEPLARVALDSGADSLAVLEVPAGLRLRAAGIQAPVFAWLHGQHTDFAAAIEADIDLGVSALWQLEAISRAAQGTRARIHLKIDTGLHRNGARPEDWPALVTAAVAAQRAGRVEVVALWSHLADASPAEDAAALARFHDAVSLAADLGCTPPLLHLAASSAGIREPEARLGLVRFGIAAYGISPFDDATAADLGLRPVMTLRSRVVAIQGERAVVPLGSADGVPRPAVGRAHLAVDGRTLPLVSLGIDSLELDASGGAPRIGALVTVFGTGDSGEASAELWATWAETIGDEIVARSSERVPRRFVG